MDPVTHTLAGAALGRAGLARATPLAMTALVVGANIPDVDILASFGGPDLSLGFRRGWTHGPIGLLVLPLLLVGLLWIWRRFTATSDDPPIHYGRLAAMAYLATLTHPVLDWLNTYGMRFLMPFSGTWYYGDAVFIVDPWIWLMLACPVMLATTASLRGKAWWIIGGGLATALMLLTPFVPAVGKVVWLLGVGVLVVSRIKGTGIANQAVARLAVGGVVGYTMLMFAGSAMARLQVVSVSGAPMSAVVMAGPVPANPFQREVITRQNDAYTVYLVNWMFRGRAVVPLDSVPINDGPEARAAMAAPELEGFADWVRLPTYQVSATADGYRVNIVDQRYARPGGFGTATVLLTEDLRPIGVEVN